MMSIALLLSAGTFHNCPMTVFGSNLSADLATQSIIFGCSRALFYAWSARVRARRRRRTLYGAFLI